MYGYVFPGHACKYASSFCNVWVGCFLLRSVETVVVIPPTAAAAVWGSL